MTNCQLLGEHCNVIPSRFTNLQFMKKYIQQRYAMPGPGTKFTLWLGIILGSDIPYKDLNTKISPEKTPASKQIWFPLPPIVWDVYGDFKRLKTGNMGLVTLSDFIGQNGHQGYKQRADSDEANTRGRHLLTVDTPPAPIFPLSLMKPWVGGKAETHGGVAILKLTSKQHNGQTSYLPGMFDLFFLSLTQTGKSNCKILLYLRPVQNISHCKLTNKTLMIICSHPAQWQRDKLWDLDDHFWNTNIKPAHNTATDKAIWYKGFAIWTKGISVIITIATNLHKVIS